MGTELRSDAAPAPGPQALTPDTLLQLCECGCAARSQSAALAHAVPEDDLAMAQDYFRTVAAQELQTPW